MDTDNVWAIDKDTGKAVHINDVPRGNACNCKCLNCGLDLQARKGGVRKYHFKHIIGAECNPETILHQLAKRIFLECNYFNLPEDKGKFHYYGVKEEVSLDDIKPDIVLTGMDQVVHVEVAVTSFINALKENKIIVKGYNTIEIDLSDIDRNSSYEEIKKIVIEETGRKEMIYWYDRPITITDEKDDNNWWTILSVLVIGFILWLCCRPRMKMKSRR